ncbi:hypothetical protein X740_15765 [Mesorhizobium sp. LNHC221B00]|uniref:hypothetical protein n=1 Tax=Mesorhizobium sp. LNHC221B00 TaxID=1287233 RepID=UPI0003CF2B01|nr:hypothetical protein [Mesorhizobium sp. LNHC221B00]ESY79267.1 hypothetical protein X740_15765 [Mesorhizobium sp. LNHC221B00]
MARDIEKRLRQLNTRRRGTDRLGRLSEAAKLDVLTKSFTDEAWQKRALSQPYTRYALGGMAEVGPEYTQKSIETAERVGKQLKDKLEANGRSVEFRLQGSVPLNVHIRGVSDVDLLNLEAYFLSYYVAGPRAIAGLYGSPGSESSVDRLLRLRKESERILIDAYPAADVDTTGGKAICISGGSLARPVDVVPSHWVDTIAYQSTQQLRDRGVTILNKKVPETIDNMPFLHIDRVHQRDLLEAGGGLKKAIRLAKNVKNDAIEDGKDVPLPSFDIAGIMYHANQSMLQTGRVYELAILSETQRFLEVLRNNRAFARTLDVPDGTRKIFDSDRKFVGLDVLSTEIDDLAREVAREQTAMIRQYDALPLEESRKAIEKAFVPG